ncbi:uncharacterized protein LOC142463587 [Ascaphus truei]|uniref:uncharacterized protein LOC142463587 n=1 Tax=Ascaphus truei TaxID=8439 RepID=UPI003F5A76E9
MQPYGDSGDLARFGRRPAGGTREEERRFPIPGALTSIFEQLHQTSSLQAHVTCSHLLSTSCVSIMIRRKRSHFPASTSAAGQTLLHVHQTMLSLLALLSSLPICSSSTSLPPLAYSCRPGTWSECKKVPFVPGHTLLGEGFDIVTMKKTRAFLLNLQRYAAPDKTCTVCNNPHKKGALQKLPLALVDWRPQSSCSRKITSEVSRSTLSLAKESASSVQNDWEAGLELQHKAGSAKLVLAGSQSELARFTQGKTSTDRYSFVRHQLSCSYYRYMDLRRPLAMDLRRPLAMDLRWPLAMDLRWPLAMDLRWPLAMDLRWPLAMDLRWPLAMDLRRPLTMESFRVQLSEAGRELGLSLPMLRTDAPLANWRLWGIFRETAIVPIRILLH